MTQIFGRIRDSIFLNEEENTNNKDKFISFLYNSMNMTSHLNYTQIYSISN